MATDTNGEDASEVAGRRKSGRVVRKPEIFGEEENDRSLLTNGSVKRKRARVSRDMQELDDSDENEDESEAEDESDEDEPDEEEVREKQRTQRKKAATEKPAKKRSKTANGISTTLAIRAAKPPSKPASKAVKQKARSRPSQIQATGLYADVFGKGNTAEDVAGEWHEGLQKDNVAGIRDLVNFILQCAGCDVAIESSDIEDIDNVPTRLGDVVDEYAQQNNTEYPLASKSKQYTGFKDVLRDFFNAVIHVLHNSGLLYDEPAIYDNIHIWTATMAGAGYRSFRHTAAVVSLSMTTALCEVVQELQGNAATAKTQLEAEKKKKTTNKARVSKLQGDMKRDSERLEAVDALLRDAFDTVYVHRYRDVDEKIRVECVTALGNWIVLYRKMFLEGQYLRYLGWVLSDPNSTTRLEVLRALKMLFKVQGNVGALRAFTERFRSRIVEMGARDTDTSVRAEAIELLDRLRNAELLEPDDIDTVGQLIFDNEPRVRRAVAKFFVSNIEDLYSTSTEDLDKDQYATILPAKQKGNDFFEPARVWIKFKCLAQTLAANAQDNGSGRNGKQQHIYDTEDVETRYMLATQSVFPYMPELEKWESLAGYLLFDHTSIPAEADGSDTKSAVQAAYRLDNGEDTILLDVLYYAVKLYLQKIIESETQQKNKSRSQASKSEVRRKQEAAAQNLTLIIPQLLNKFGSIPEAATSILRLEQLLDVDLINDLQSGEADYAKILDDINKQFTSHNDRKVLAEASKALRTARSYETSKEAADAKVSEIWNDSREALGGLLHGKNIPTRGTLDRNILRSAGDIMSRLAQLAAVSDCTEVLETRLPAPMGKKTKGKVAVQETLIDVLIGLVHRGASDEDTTDNFAELEDRLCQSVLTVVSFYFRWKVVTLRSAIMAKNPKVLSTGLLTTVATRRSSFVEALVPVVSSRAPLDSVRVDAILTLLELFTLFATIRHMKPAKGELDEEIQSNLTSLTVEASTDVQNHIMETHEKMEKRLARGTKKRIELPLEEVKKSRNKQRRSGVESNGVERVQDEDEDVEKPPEDSDDEGSAEDEQSEPDDDLSNGDGSGDEQPQTAAQGREVRKQAALIAEQSLCELTSKLVLACIALILGKKGSDEVKKRLQVNRTKLGKNYTQVIAYLDEKKEKGRAKAKADSKGTLVEAMKKKQAEKEKGRKSEPMVLEDDDIEDEDEGDAEGVNEELQDDPIEEEVEDEGNDAEDAAGQDDEGGDDDEIMGD